MEHEAKHHPSRARLFRLHRPLARYFRTKRLQQFVADFSVDSTTRVLDLGGLAFYWTFLDEPPQVTIVNLEPPLDGAERERGPFLWARAARSQAHCEALSEREGAIAQLN